MANYVIAGATSGIGLELAKLLYENGHSIWSISRSLNHPISGINHISIDLSKETVSAGLLPDTISGLAYCPGSINLKPFHRITTEEWIVDLQVNLLGAVRLLQITIPAMKKSGNASVVLFSTVAVKTGMAFHASIAASKGAVEGLTRSLAAEWAPDIRVNAIAPSLTDTPLAERLLASPEKRDAGAKRHPLKRVGTALELAQAAQFLLSEQAGWITGQVLHVDGGMSGVRLM